MRQVDRIRRGPGSRKYLMSGTTLFVGNLSYRMTDDDLYDAFKDYGNIVSAKISRERGTQRSRGFGYVTFDIEGEAMSALEKCNGSEVHGRNIRVEISQTRENRYEQSDSSDRRNYERRGSGQRGGRMGRYRDNNRYNDNEQYQNDGGYSRNTGYNRRGGDNRGGGRGRYRNFDHQRNEI